MNIFIRFSHGMIIQSENQSKIFICIYLFDISEDIQM